MGAFGFFGQPAEEREAAIDRLEDEHREKLVLSSALAKIGSKVSTLAKGFPPNASISVRFTVEELRALRQFGRKFHDE